MSDYADIIARLEKATGPDWKIDYDIMWAISEWKNVGGFWVSNKKSGERRRSGVNEFAPAAYTAAIDAALTLVPEGCQWTFNSFENEASVRDAAGRFLIGGDMESFGRGATPGIAICIAALRARQNIVHENGT